MIIKKVLIFSMIIGTMEIEGATLNEDLIRSVSDHLRMHKLMFVCRFDAENSNSKRKWLSTFGRPVKIQTQPEMVTVEDVVLKVMEKLGIE